MNMNVSSPMTIFVHQELRLPLNWIRVWVSPRMSTPNRVPMTYPDPPASDVPPITTAAMALNS